MLYITRELKIKITMRCHYLLISTAKMQNTNTTKCWQGCGEIEPLVHRWWECKMAQPLWKMTWCFLTKQNILLWLDPAVVFLSIYPKELKPYVHEKTCMRMFIAVLFTIARTWNQPRCPSVSEWIGKLRYMSPREGMATHSSILAWRIPWTEKPGGLQSMRSQKAGHDWATNTYRQWNIIGAKRKWVIEPWKDLEET